VAPPAEAPREDRERKPHHNRPPRSGQQRGDGGNRNRDRDRGGERHGGDRNREGKGGGAPRQASSGRDEKRGSYDPSSPFAALSALKQQLEDRKRS